MNHLPVRLGFSAGHLGFLSGAMAYHGTKRWRGETPFHSEEYSTDLYGAAAVAALEAYEPSKGRPLFMYLPWQAVHTPYTPPPHWNASAQKCDHNADACVVYAMLSVADSHSCASHVLRACIRPLPYIGTGCSRSPTGTLAS